MKLLNKGVSSAWQRTVSFYIGALLSIAPFTSVVLWPAVSASVPAFVLIYLFLPFFIYYSLRRQDGFFKELTIIAVVFTGINMLAQLYVYYSGVQLSPQLILVKTANPEQVFFRKSMITQSAYLFAGIVAYLYVKNYARPRHLPYLYWGLRILVVYGLLEILLFQLTGSNGDIISNRQFDHTSGSLFQTMKVGSIVVQRLKSLTGEPSMFAFTIVPFWILAVGLKRKLDMVLFALALLLTFSTSAYLGIALLVAAIILHEKRVRKYSLGALAFLLFITLGLYYASSGFHHFMHDLVLDKLTGSNTSGQERSHFMKDHLGFWWNHMNIAGKFTGLGFGYVRSTDFFSTLLVNNGLIGFFLFTGFYFKHAFILFRNNRLKFYYRTALVATYLIMMLSVPEFAYLSLWILLAAPKIIDNRMVNRVGYS